MKRSLAETKRLVEEAAKPFILIALAWLLDPKTVEKVLPRKGTK